MTLKQPVLNNATKALLLDGFKKGMNEGVSSLSSMLGENFPVRLSESDVEILSAEKLNAIMPRLEDVYVMQLNVEGTLDSTSILYMKEEHSMCLASALLNVDDASVAPPDKADALCEVANILINACLIGISQTFHLKFEGTVPESKPVEELNIADDKKVLYFQLAFEETGKRFHGNVGIVLSERVLQAMSQASVAA